MPWRGRRLTRGSARDPRLQTKDGVLTTLRKELGLTGEDHDDIKGLVMEDDYITALRSAGTRRQG